MAGRRYQIQIGADVVKLYVGPWVLAPHTLTRSAASEEFRSAGAPVISTATCARNDLDPQTVRLAVPCGRVSQLDAAR